MNTLLDERCAEIDQQPKPLVCKFEIRFKLLLVHRKKDLDAFDFDDDQIVYEEIDLEGVLEIQSTVGKSDGVLTNRRQAALVQFSEKDAFLYRFEQAGTWFDMDVVGRIDDLFGKGIFRHNPVQTKAITRRKCCCYGN